METKKSSIVKTVAVFVISAVIVFNSASVYASNSKILKGQSDTKKMENGLANLKMGLQSDNAGLKKSSICLIGLYKMAGGVDALIEQLKVETDPEIKNLIALSLFKIGDPKGYEAIKSLSENDENVIVRDFCKEICKQYLEIFNSGVAQSGTL
jgi:hypothetical protein